MSARTEDVWTFADDSEDPRAIGLHCAHTSDARKVACVNACAGIPTETLTLGGPFAAARAAITERDALAAALRDVLPYAEACVGPTWRQNPPSDSVITAAKALLAKVLP